MLNDLFFSKLETCSTKVVQMIRALILLRDYRSIGGVVNVNNTMIANFSKKIIVERFIIGRRRGKNSIYLRVIQTFVDAANLAIKVLKKKYTLIHINPSIRIFSLLRDSLFIVTLRCIGFKNIIIFFHGWNSKIIKAINKHFILNYFFMRLFGNAKAIIVLALCFKQELVDTGIPSNKIHVLTTMFHRDIFKRITPPTFKNRHQLLFLSRIVKEKGIYELVDAFENLRYNYNDLKLIFAGDGPELKALTKYVYKKELKKSVFFPGYVRDKVKAKILIESDIFVLPSYNEGCPVSLLEAMAAGLAVVTTPVGGIPDIIENNINGILLDCRPTPSQIYVALKRLLKDRNYCTTIQINNLRKAWDLYEAKIVTGKIEKIYEQAVGYES